MAVALQLEAARATPAFPPLITSHAKFEVAEPIHCRIIAFFDADTLCFTVTLTFYPLTLKVCGTSNVT